MGVQKKSIFVQITFWLIQEGQGQKLTIFTLCLLLRIGQGVKNICKCAYVINGWPLRPTTEGKGNAFASFLDSSTRYSCNQKVCKTIV